MNHHWGDGDDNEGDNNDRVDVMLADSIVLCKANAGR
jgi:hypothetical protein